MKKTLKYAALFHFCSGVILPGLGSFPAIACTPVNAIGIFFEHNSSDLSMSQAERLSAWTAGMKEKYPNRDLIETEVRVENTEENVLQLGWRREFNVRHALVKLDFDAAELSPSDGVFIEDPRPAGVGGDTETRSVWINLIPGCPHECPCPTTESGEKFHRHH